MAKMGLAAPPDKGGSGGVEALAPKSGERAPSHGLADAAPSVSAGAVQDMVDVAPLPDMAKGNPGGIEMPDPQAPDEAAISSDVVSSPPVAVSSDPTVHWPSAEASAASLAVRAPQTFVAPQPAPVGAAPSGAISVPAARPTAQSPPLPQRTIAPDGPGADAEQEAQHTDPDAMPEAQAPVPLPVPLRVAHGRPSAPLAAEAKSSGVTSEPGFAALPSIASAFISRPVEVAAPPPPPPMRQLTPIVIALAFTPGAANGFNLTLDPVELGRVEIRVQREADGHSVRIVAERPETLALLQRDRHELDRSLADAGLRVESGGIDFALGNSGAGRDAPRDTAARQAQRGRGGTPQAEDEPPPNRAIRGLLDLNI